MSGHNNIRLMKEFKSMKQKPVSEYIKVHGLIKDNLNIWEVYLIGPPNTYYSKGVYKAFLRFPDDYPMKPPSLQFHSEIFHPNIYKDGKVCISTLQTGKEGSDAAHYWRPVLGVEQALLSVISLLSDPNLGDPANTAAANLFKNNLAEFEKKCKNLAEKSLKFLPKEFEFPKTVQIKIEKKVEREIRVEMDEDEFEYDLEDLSEEEEEEEKTSVISHSLGFKDDEDPNIGGGFLDPKSTPDKERKKEREEEKKEEREENYQNENNNTAQDSLQVLNFLEKEVLFPVEKKKKRFGFLKSLKINM